MPKKAESIKVVFRVRPLSSKEKQNGCKIATIAHEKEGVIEIRDQSTSGSEGETSKAFTFDAVFSDKSSQRHIYDVCAAPVVKSVLEGYNGTVFAYGQTGSGKTHTMEGVASETSLRGIIPNAFEHIFDHIALNGSNDKYLVRASYFEIYNEEIIDLLTKSSQRLELHESDSGAVFVKDLTDVVVKSVPEIDNVLQRGKKNRSVGATLMNAESSRSHSIFSIVVECCSNDGQKERIRVGKLNLVDLAGSERQSKTGATGERLKEATKINLSLSALGNVISALVDGKSNHIPYRDSKLTRILQDSLGGNTKTVMCANAGPADYNYDESLSTLRYANRAKNIKNRPVINEDPKDAMLREYQDEIARLKERLSQMPSASASAPAPAVAAVSDADREAILKECRTKAGKESEDIIATKEAEMKTLKMNHDQTAEERAALQKKLEDEMKARMDTEQQRLDLHEQLRKMEEELMIGGEIANNAAKQEAALRNANQELIAKKEVEASLHRRMAEQEDEKLVLEEKYSSLNEEVTSKTRKLKKIFSKYQQAKAEIKDLEREFINEKNELLESVRDLTKQLKLKAFVISKFIPPKYALLYNDVENGGRAVWDEAEERWKIPGLKIEGGDMDVMRERSMTSQSHHRPETDYARQRRLVDPNPRWRTEDIVDLEIMMPARTTPHRDDPNTVGKIRAILAMDLEGDPPAQKAGGGAKHREDQFLCVNDGPSGKSRSRRVAKDNDNAKREESSRKSSTRPKVPEQEPSRKSYRPTTAV